MPSSNTKLRTKSNNNKKVRILYDIANFDFAAGPSSRNHLLLPPGQDYDKHRPAFWSPMFNPGSKNLEWTALSPDLKLH
jgi:hypothetical protein